MRREDDPVLHVRAHRREEVELERRVEVELRLVDEEEWRPASRQEGEEDDKVGDPGTELLQTVRLPVDDDLQRRAVLRCINVELREVKDPAELTLE